MKTRFHLLYSIALLIVIPGILILNTLWWVKESRRNADLELENKAVLLATTFASEVVNNLSQPEKIRATINAISTQQPQVKELTVYKLEGEYLIPVASSNQSRLKTRLSELSTIPAWRSKQATFTFEGEYQESSLQRAGSVYYPLLDSEANPLGMITVKLSYALNDQQTQAIFNRSVIILFAAVTFIVLLLANHFRMIESTVLLQKLREIDKMKDDFISMASHELRTPLTAIKGFASMLLEGSGGSLNEKGKHYMEVVINSADGLAALVGDMLDVSRIEQGRMTFAMETVNFTEITQAITDQLQIPAANKGLVLNFQAPPNPMFIKADPAKIRQVLFNLVGNAVKYTEKGSVVVYYQISNRECRLVIQDTGIGMSEEDRKNLFGKFYRIHNDKTKKITGTGLGLWITKQLVEKMGGRIEVQSQVGVGSRFMLVFPMVS